MDIVDRIFELVAQKYKEQKDFAADIDVDPARISEWKKRKSKSYRSKLDTIASVLGTTSDYLLNGTQTTWVTPTPASSELQRLSNALEELNEEGREKLLDYAADLVASGRYRKNDTARLGQKA